MIWRRGVSRHIERRLYLGLIKSDDNLSVDNQHRDTSLIGQGDHFIPGGLVLIHVVLGKRIIPLRKKLFRATTMGSGGKREKPYLCHVGRSSPCGD
jgi:hypothetical protein